MKTSLRVGIGVAALAAVGWCVAEDKPAAVAGSAVTGKITWEGAVPERQKLEVNKDNDKCECDAKGGDKKPFKLDESLVVDADDKGVANCVVWLKGATGGPVLGPVEITQQGCVFTPHVSVITKGQKVKLLNPDGISHNFHWWSKDNPADNKTMAKFKKSMDVPENGFEKPEFVRVTCDIHLWMGGWIAVMENGYAARTDEKGAFKIEGVPPGKYTLALWHEPLSKEGGALTQEKEITVETGKAAEASFTLSADKK